MPRKLLVLGPLAQVVIVLSLLATALAFALLKEMGQAGLIVGGVLGQLPNMLPVARGRPTDFARVVTRATTKPPEDPWKSPRK